MAKVESLQGKAVFCRRLSDGTIVETTVVGNGGSFFTFEVKGYAYGENRHDDLAVRACYTRDGEFWFSAADIGVRLGMDKKTARLLTARAKGTIEQFNLGSGRSTNCITADAVLGLQVPRGNGGYADNAPDILRSMKHWINASVLPYLKESMESPLRKYHFSNREEKALAAKKEAEKEESIAAAAAPKGETTGSKTMDIFLGLCEPDRPAVTIARPSYETVVPDTAASAEELQSLGDWAPVLQESEPEPIAQAPEPEKVQESAPVEEQPAPERVHLAPVTSGVEKCEVCEDADLANAAARIPVLTASLQQSQCMRREQLSTIQSLRQQLKEAEDLLEEINTDIAKESGELADLFKILSEV